MTKISKMILFEGQDRCGKGTQINLLYKLLANKGHIVHVEHFSNPGIKDVQKCIDWSDKLYHSMFATGVFMLKHGNWFICDRAHLGEWVYGKKYRNYDANFIWHTEASYEYYEDGWLSNNVCLIVFTDSTENLLKRDDGLGHSSKAEDFDWEQERFKDAFDRSLISKKLYINIKHKSIEDIHNEIINFIFNS